MKRRIGLFFLFSICVSALFPITSGGIFASIASDLEKISPRAENSENERAFFSYLQERSTRLGLTVRFKDFSGSKGSHSFSRIAMVRIEGSKADSLVIAVAADSTEGNPGNVSAALALTLMETLSSGKAEDRPISVEFLFLGAEFGSTADGRSEGYPLGSKLAISEFPESRPTAVIYLTMDALSRRVKIDNYAPGLVSPYWIFKKAADSLGKAGFGLSQRGSLNLFYRASIVDDSCAASPFLQEDIPAVELGRKGDAVSPGAEDPVVDQWVDFIGIFLDSNRDGFDDSWDRHYFILDGPKGPLVITESSFVLLIIGVILVACIVFMLSSIFARKTVIGLFSGFGESFFSLPLCFALCLAVLYASSLLMSAVFALRGSGEFWKAAPIPYMIAHGIVIFAVFATSCAFLMRVKLMPLTISFYGAGSSLLFFAAIFVYSAMDISFSMFFAWASISCIISMLFRNRPVGVLSYLLILAPFALLFSGGGFENGSGLQRLLIVPDFVQCLILAFLALPLLLFLIRVVLLFYRPASALSKTVLKRIVVVCVCLIVPAIVFLFVFQPYSRTRPIPVTAVEEWEGPGRAGRLLVTSPATLSSSWIDFPEGRIDISGRSPIILPLDARDEDDYGLSAARTTFLNRKRILISLTAAPKTVRIECSMEIGAGMHIYDCSFPYELSSDGKRAEIFIGMNPKTPLSLEMTVSKDFEGELTAEFISEGGNAVGLSPGLRLSGYSKIERRSILLR